MVEVLLLTESDDQLNDQQVCQQSRYRHTPNPSHLTRIALTHRAVAPCTNRIDEVGESRYPFTQKPTSSTNSKNPVQIITIRRWRALSERQPHDYRHMVFHRLIIRPPTSHIDVPTGMGAGGGRATTDNLGPKTRRRLSSAEHPARIMMAHRCGALSERHPHDHRPTVLTTPSSTSNLSRRSPRRCCSSGPRHDHRLTDLQHI